MFGGGGEGEQDPEHKKHAQMGVFLVFGEPGTTKNTTVMSRFFMLCRVFRGGAEGERAGKQWEGGVTWEGGGGDIFNMKGGLMVASNTQNGQGEEDTEHEKHA